MKDEMQVILGNIETLRNKNRMTATSLVAQANKDRDDEIISDSDYSKIKNNTKKLSLLQFIAIADALGVSLDYLAGKTDINTRNSGGDAEINALDFLGSALLDDRLTVLKEFHATDGAPIERYHLIFQKMPCVNKLLSYVYELQNASFDIDFKKNMIALTVSQLVSDGKKEIKKRGSAEDPFRDDDLPFIDK